MPPTEEAPPQDPRQVLKHYGECWIMFTRLLTELADQAPGLFRSPGQVRDTMLKLADIADELEDQFNVIDSRTDN